MGYDYVVVLYLYKRGAVEALSHVLGLLLCHALLFDLCHAVCLGVGVGIFILIRLN